MSVIDELLAHNREYVARHGHRELATTPRLHLAVLTLALVFPFVFPSAFMLNIGVMALFYAFIGQSWNISGGFAGLLSFGHVAFFGAGAYASTIVQMRLGWSPWMGLPASALAGFHFQ